MTITTTRNVVVDTPMGPLALVRDDDGLTGLYYPGHWTRPRRAIFGPRVEQEDDPVFSAAITQLKEYFARRRQSFVLPVVSRGSCGETTV